MLIELLFNDPRMYFAWIICVILSITLHELAHGWAAIKLGDRTPIDTGHMTLNPVVHMGWFSIIMACTIGFAFGAMPVDPTRFRGKYADAIVSVAGPAMNFLIAIIALVVYALFVAFFAPQLPKHVVENLAILLSVMAFLNIMLGLLNLIPVPPLDGSKILANFNRGYANLISDPTMQGVFFAVVIAVMIFGGRVLSPIAQNIVNVSQDAILSLLGK
jgi:Zn-dependent protease